MYTTHVYTKRSVFHTLSNEPCQDVACIKNNIDAKNIVIGLADGVGGMAFSRIGAKTALKYVFDYILSENPQKTLSLDPDITSKKIATGIYHELENLSESYNVAIEQFGSTVAAVLVDIPLKKLFYISIGDSSIFAIDKNKSVCKIATYNGENTFYTTSHKVDVQTGIMDISNLNSIYIGSDGFLHQIMEHRCYVYICHYLCRYS